MKPKTIAETEEFSVQVVDDVAQIHFTDAIGVSMKTMADSDIGVSIIIKKSQLDEIVKQINRMNKNAKKTKL